MPSAFADLFEDVAQPVMEDWFGTQVILLAGARQTAAFTAIGTRAEYESIELETGLPIKVASRDWLLPIASLIAGGVAIEPRAGHRIVEDGIEYEICPIAGRPAVEPHSDGYRVKVHSQRVQT
jgi:hypothetical protein